jgi:hypothetical protein
MRLLKSAVLAAAVLSAGAAQAQGSLSGVFDGFCDGFAVTWSANNVAFGAETGCVTGPISGGRGFVFRNGGAGTLVLNLNHVPDAVYFIRQNGTWSIYLSDGSELQSGTWSPVGAATAGSRPTGTN